MLNISSESRNPFGQPRNLCLWNEEFAHQRQTVWDSLFLYNFFFLWNVRRVTYVKMWLCQNEAFSCESYQQHEMSLSTHSYFFFFSILFWHSPWTKNYAEKHNMPYATAHQHTPAHSKKKLNQQIKSIDRSKFDTPHIFRIEILNFFYSTKQVVKISKIHTKTC